MDHFRLPKSTAASPATARQHRAPHLNRAFP
jgi:hypothetical protein